MKIIINNLVDNPIDNLSFVTERAYHPTSDDQPKTMFLLEAARGNVPSNYSIKQMLGWLMELDKIESIKVYNDNEELIWEYDNYNKVDEIFIMNDNEVQINNLIIHFV